MSIEPPRAARQDSPSATDRPGNQAEAGAAGAAPESGQADAVVRRIFICYPRAALKEVAAFDKTLRARLNVRSRTYTVFRDKADTGDEKVAPADNYRELIAAKLAQSACCVVILVPSIFESVECEIEVKEFEKVAKSERGFFFPIEFVSVAGAMDQTGSEIARVLRYVDRYDFTDCWWEPSTAQYEKRVDEIAENIHRRISKRPAAMPAPAPAPQPSPRPWPKIWMFIAALAGVAVVGAAAIVPIRQWFAGPTQVQTQAPVVWTEVDLAFDPVTEVAALAEPRVGAPAAPPLGPGTLAGGIGPIDAIRRGQTDGRDWYQFEMDDHSKRYVEARLLTSEWKPLRGCLYTKQLGMVQRGVADPMVLSDFTAEQLIRAAGDVVQSREADGRLWYRYRREQRIFGYVRSDYAEFRPVQQCH